MSEWKRVKLDEICVIEKGITGIQKAVPGDYPLVVTSEARKTNNTFQFDSEAVIIPLVSSTGHGHASIKRIHFQKGKFALGSILCAVIPKDTKVLSAEYLYMFLDLNKEKELVSRMKGMANVTLSIKEISQIQIPLPPIHVQEKIVTLLRNKLVKVRNLKELYDTSLEESKNILPAILGTFFKKGESKGWKEMTINEISKTIQYGYTASAKSNGDAKLLRITDIQNGIVNWSAVPFCSCDDIAKYRLNKGDLVFARTGATVGKSYMISNPPVNAIFASYLIRMQIKDNVLPEFVYYFFQSSLYWDQISDHKAGAAQPNVNGSKLRNLKIPVPSLVEQRSVVQKLNKLSKKAEDLVSNQFLGRSVLESLEATFFEEAFIGKEK